MVHVYEHTDSISSSNFANLFMVKFISFHEIQICLFFFLSMVIILLILFGSRDSPFSVLFHFLKGFFPSTNKSYVTIDLLNIVNKNKHLPQLDKPWVSEHIYFLNPQLDMILWHPMKHTCIIKLYLPLHVHSYKIL